jgi:hypothetical protein
MKVKKIKLRGQISHEAIKRKAMTEAGLDPARFGKRFRSRVEVNRKRAERGGYRKHKGQ